MSEKTREPSVDELREAYASAVLAFSEASSVLVLKLAVNSAPSDEQIRIEQDARAVVVSARRRLWGRLPETEIFLMILPSHITGGEWVRLREDYARALLTHAEAGAVIAARLAAVALPTDEEFELEDSAALALLTARRELWKVWRACKTTEVQRAPVRSG
jgi:hypothetical protein